MITYIKEEIGSILSKAAPAGHSFQPFGQDAHMTATVTMIGIMALYTYYYKYKYQYFAKMGIKNPFPLPVIGNLMEMLLVPRIQGEVSRPKKYGKVYGVYLGTKAFLVVADPDVSREISIKAFDRFTNHHLDASANEIQKNFLFFMKDAHWKRVRSTLSPTFTSGKIKRMFKLMQHSVDELVEIFDKNVKQNKPIDNKKLFGLYTMDVVATCLYAIKLQVSEDGNVDKSSRDAFVDDALNMTKPHFHRILINFLTPNFILRKAEFTITPRRCFDNFANKSLSLVETRRRSGKKVDDYLQLLMDARLNDKLEVSEMDEMENHHVGISNKEEMIKNHDQMTQEAQGSNNNSINQAKDAGLSDLEILANAMFLLMVGYETTNSLLSNCLYVLAHIPEVQEKLHEELKSVVESDGKTFDYDKLTSSIYLDSVISETLRLMSPVIYLDRESSEDHYVEKLGITIPKGTVINMAFYAIHHDPDYWPEPEKFDPSRFFPENRHKIKLGSYTPFGHGPRHCIGMRFSLTEAKLAIARLLMEFQFKPIPGSVFPPRPKFSLFLNNYADLKVLASRRQVR